MIMFLDPLASGVGANEQQLRAARIPYRYAVYGYDLVDRASGKSGGCIIGYASLAPCS